jgi:hypothetical protein
MAGAGVGQPLYARRRAQRRLELLRHRHRQLRVGFAPQQQSGCGDCSQQRVGIAGAELAQARQLGRAVAFAEPQIDEASLQRRRHGVGVGDHPVEKAVQGRRRYQREHPVRPAGDLAAGTAVGALEPAGVDQHQALDTLRMRRRQGEGDVAAKAGADQVHALELQPVEQPGQQLDIARHLVAAARVRAGEPVAAEVVAQHLEVRRERRHPAVPHAHVEEVRMDQHQRRATAAEPVADVDAIDRRDGQIVAAVAGFEHARRQVAPGDTAVDGVGDRCQQHEPDDRGNAFQQSA